ncbi:MAG: YeeE/YedE family protein, partial [Mesorhizobium sp.]
MTDFTPFQSLLGGALIGLSAVLLMAFHGRIAGMTGILTGVIPPLSLDWRWRAAFLAGAVLAPLLYGAAGGQIAFSVPVPTLALVVGGFLVGIGVHF